MKKCSGHILTVVPKKNLYVIWTGNARIMNMSEYQCGQICPDISNLVNIPEYAWNMTCVSKPELYIYLSLLK